VVVPTQAFIGAESEARNLEQPIRPGVGEILGNAQFAPIRIKLMFRCIATPIVNDIAKPYHA
jgi:hypothetical protein